MFAQIGTGRSKTGTWVPLALPSMREVDASKEWDCDFIPGPRCGCCEWPMIRLRFIDALIGGETWICDRCASYWLPLFTKQSTT